MNSSISDYNIIEVELETECDGQILIEERKSDDFIEDESSDDYTYELIDQSIHSSNLPVMS